MSNFIDLYDLPIYNDLETELLQLADLTANQYCITCPKGHEDNVFYGTGSLKYDWSKSTIKKDGSVDVPLRDTVIAESDFTEVCDLFKNTSFEEIYKALSNRYIVGRLRIMIMEPSMCLTWHQDTEERIHYPIKTQEGCFMVIEDEIRHLEQNKWYYTKTLKKHTAFNGSKDRRIHLVANILGLR